MFENKGNNKEEDSVRDKKCVTSPDCQPSTSIGLSPNKESKEESEIKKGWKRSYSEEL